MDGSGSSIPLSRAHAHNDYEHERPLKDALMRARSVEADVLQLTVPCGWPTTASIWTRTHIDQPLPDPLQKLISNRGGLR